MSLIQSMSKTEKRYFVAEQKKQNSDSNIYKLYKVVCDQNKYDESEIKKSLKKEKFVQILPTIKNQLYKALLRSLRDYQSKSNIDFIIRNEITEIDILIKKKLYLQALKKINSLNKLIIKHERFTYQMELILKETELKFYVQKNKEFSYEITRAITNARSAGKNFYSYAYQKLMLLRTQSMLWDAKTFDDINYDPTREKERVSIRSAHYFHLHHVLLYYVQIKEFVTSVKVAKNLLQIMQDNPHEFEDNPEQKVDVWYACAMAYLYSDNQKMTTKLIQNITDLKEDNDRLFIRKTERLIDLKLLQILVNNRVEYDLEKIFSDIENYKKDFSNFYIQKIWDSLATIYLKQDDFKRAIKMNYNNLLFKKANRAEHYYIRALLRELYLYYRLGKLNLFESRYRSISRSNLALSQQEKVLLHNLKNNKKVTAFKAYLIRKKKS